MTLSPGTRLGPYEIAAPIGAGGMGEVYRATDTNLARQVAVKVLPESVAADPERLARFEREARTLAALNHPNIAQVHGLERADGSVALVMELVEGPTLADRIAHGPVPVDEALPIARQLVDALETAHEQGIIHRDLKPANIKVRPDGAVKVLDFGLAKAMDPVGGSLPPGLSQSPTITTPAMTQAGMILGTAAYMSPEQAKGKPVDKRTDIWAFGAVVYEMLSGRRAFPGDDVSETIASILARQPDWSAVPADLPRPLRKLLARCLERDPRRRLRDIGDALPELDEAVAAPRVADVSPRTTSRPSVGWRVATAAAIVAAGIAGWAAGWRLRPEAPMPIARLIASPPGEGLALSANSRDIAFSPDGRRIVYARVNAGLFVRTLDRLDPAPLDVNPNSADPFISPDGRWVGFFNPTESALQKVSIDGGLPIVISRGVTNFRGATWGADNMIVFATSDRATGLFRVSADGGEPEPLTTPDLSAGGEDHLWPEFLPDGRHVLFALSDPSGASRIAVLDLETGRYDVLLQAGSGPKYSASGHLVYGVDGALRAVAFDARRLQLQGSETPVVPGVVTKASGAVNFGIAADGSLAYVAGSPLAGTQRTLVWVDRDGREEPLSLPARAYNIPRVSPDGRRMAVSITTEAYDLWTADFARGALERLTLGPGQDNDVTWSPDGARVAYYSIIDGVAGIYLRSADGTGDAEHVTTGNHRPLSWGPGGKWLVFTDINVRDIGAVDLTGDRTPQWLVTTDSREDVAAISPDGRWLAFETEETGQAEIFVRPFPDVATGRWRISTDGGLDPVWSPDGRTLFYRRNRTIMAVAVEGESPLEWRNPEPLFDADYYYSAGPRQFDIAPDGRFLMIKDASRDQSERPPQLVVVQSWGQELTRLVPTD